MLSATFIGEIQQGRLQTGQPLTAFEGKRVLVTLIVPDAPLPSSSPTGAGVPGPQAAPEAEILEDPGRIRASPRTTQTVAAQVIAVGRPVPRLSTQEE
jgi:hypothetical protein